ncbi:uncharacterized protein STEHIDRAFT_164049 [Stereum hirsutum FP-91666 SS1]|uniref:Uncharacterized protein n=1 Tax=Stereum hirsutum (strain FP-91666) TaxID=721885 RepID=R7RWB4_STEHR|nr:uncharacterized protein STEHIDRAFT_164049 [Stereum hirsutum FP-91666 SS1]EIM79060.1 hypothetical protein STEHIDRAFT_164049 [Stereum hirsutum FP-91666 SS1]
MKNTSHPSRNTLLRNTFIFSLTSTLPDLSRLTDVSLTVSTSPTLTSHLHNLPHTSKTSQTHPIPLTRNTHPSRSLVTPTQPYPQRSQTSLPYFSSRHAQTHIQPSLHHLFHASIKIDTKIPQKHDFDLTPFLLHVPAYEKHVTSISKHAPTQHVHIFADIDSARFITSHRRLSDRFYISDAHITSSQPSPHLENITNTPYSTNT